MLTHKMSKRLLLLLVPAITFGCGTSQPHLADSTAPVSRTIASRNGETSHVKQISRLSKPAPSAGSDVIERPQFVDSTLENLEQEIVSIEYQEEPAQLPAESSVPELLRETSVESGEEGEGLLTLAELETLALEHNPSIGQISASSNKAVGLQTQVGLKPNPVIGYDATQIADGDNAGQQGAFVSQTFVRGDKLEANRRVLEQDYQSILWEVEVQRYRVQTDVRTRFYETLAAQTRLELATEFREVAKKGRQIAQDRLDAQEGALPDLLQAEIQLSEIDIILQRAEVAYEAAWNELVTIVGLPEMRPVPLAGELPALVEERSFETLYQQLLESSPELQAAYARAERARANVQRQELQAIPNITGELGVGRNTMTGSGYANINIALPLPIRNRNEGNIQAACADYSRALLDAQRIELSIRSRLVRTLRDFDQARVSVHQFSTVILPKARQNMELSQQAHVAGEFDFLRVLIARRTFFETNLSYLNSRVELAQAEARLDGMLLTGGLDEPATYDRDDALRGQSLSGE